MNNDINRVMLGELRALATCYESEIEQLGESSGIISSRLSYYKTRLQHAQQDRGSVAVLVAEVRAHATYGKLESETLNIYG